MIFDLVKDFADVLDAMPAEHPRRRILKLLDEAIRRDVHFIDRHPTTFFQCMWNTCWWYDCPEAEGHYEEPEDGWSGSAPWNRTGPRLYEILESWQEERQQHSITPRWIRSLRPPPIPLGGPQWAAWDTFDGQMVNSTVYSPDGARIVSSAMDGTLRVWDVATTAEILVVRNGRALSILYLPDGKQLVAGIGECVYVFAADNGVELDVFEGHESTVTSLGCSSDGQVIASGDVSGNIFFWDAESGRSDIQKRGWGASVNDLVFLPNSYRCLIAYEDGTVCAWDLDGVNKLIELPHTTTVNALAVSPDGRQFVTLPTLYDFSMQTVFCNLPHSHPCRQCERGLLGSLFARWSSNRQRGV